MVIELKAIAVGMAMGAFGTIVADAGVLLGNTMKDWTPGEWTTFFSVAGVFVTALGAVAVKIITALGEMKRMLATAEVDRKKVSADLAENTTKTNEIKTSVAVVQSIVTDKLAGAMEKIAADDPGSEAKAALAQDARSNADAMTAKTQGP